MSWTGPRRLSVALARPSDFAPMAPWTSLDHSSDATALANDDGPAGPRWLGPAALPPFGALAMTEHGDHQSRVLEDLSEAVNYRRWLASMASPYLGDDPIEFGSGIGDYAAEWLPALSRMTLSEADEGRLKVLHERFVDDPRVTVTRLMLPATERREHSAAV